MKEQFTALILGRITVVYKSSTRVSDAFIGLSLHGSCAWTQNIMQEHSDTQTQHQQLNNVLKKKESTSTEISDLSSNDMILKSVN